jgi:hypothetical protein
MGSAPDVRTSRATFTPALDAPILAVSTPIHDRHARGEGGTGTMDRQGYVMSIRDQVQRGEYRVDPAAVAAAILERIALDAGPRRDALERVLPAVDGTPGSPQLRA